MAEQGIGEYRSINAFVEAKLRTFDEAGHTFSAFFELMFRERENVMYERSEGYRIVKTTYGEARGHILSRAAALRRMAADLPENAVIGVYMDNSLAWIELFWAILCAGYRPLLMNLRLDEAFLRQALGDCGVRLVISDLRAFDVTTVDPSALPAEGEELVPERFGTELLVMSSGTSAHVKICAYTAEELYYQIVDSYDIICRCARMKAHYEGSLKQLTFLPFYHVFGLLAVYIWFAFFSRTLVQLNDMAPQTIVNTIKRHKVTHIFAVPLFWETVYAQAMKTIRGRGEKTFRKFQKAMRLTGKLENVPVLGRAFSRVAFREVRDHLFGESVQFMITGGSAIDREVLSFFNGIGYHLANGYGMTEIGITSVELSEDRRVRNAGFVGAPMSGAEYRLSDDGELLVRGRSVSRYILEGGEKKTISDWFPTGDLAECENGRWRILGRKDDLVIAPDGENLNPNLIEPRLRLPGTAGVCLVGVPNGANVDPVLLVSVNRYISAERLRAVSDDVRAAVNDLGLSTQLRSIAFVGGPLMTGTEFKLNRRRLAEDFAAGRLPLLDPAQIPEDTELDELALEIRRLFGAALDRAPEEIPMDADFFLDLGGSSLDYLAMTAQLSSLFSVSFPTEAGKTPHTAREIYRFIKDSESC